MLPHPLAPPAAPVVLTRGVREEVNPRLVLQAAMSSLDDLAQMEELVARHPENDGRNEQAADLQHSPVVLRPAAVFVLEDVVDACLVVQGHVHPALPSVPHVRRFLAQHDLPRVDLNRQT